MTDRAFVDSNVLIYAHDAGAGPKNATARALLADLWKSRAGVLSTQVLQETWVNLRRKSSRPIPREEAVRVLEDFSCWKVIVNNEASILEAVQLEERYQLSFWDALIVQAAQAAGVERIYTEDLNEGQRYGSVVVVNPFSED